MKRWLHLAARLYPAVWRARYGVEFQALVDETTPMWRDIVDVLNGGLQMRLRRAHPALTAAAIGVVGALASAAIAFNTAARFASRGTMNVRPAGPSTVSEPASLENVVQKLTRDAFTGDALMDVIARHDLYRERGQLSKDSVIERMRGDIGIQLISQSVFQVSFDADDARQAREVANDLMTQLVQSNLKLAQSN